MGLVVIKIIIMMDILNRNLIDYGVKCHLNMFPKDSPTFLDSINISSEHLH